MSASTDSDNSGPGQTASNPVTVHVPEGMRYQLVYRWACAADIGERAMPDCEFYFIDKPFALLPHRAAVMALLGPAGFIKTVLKIATGKRHFYFFKSEGKILHYAWANIGFCNYYIIGDNDAVLGELWSDKAARGRGLATEALKRAVNVLRKRGHNVFYIDTTDDNIPCQKAIARAGFPPACALYLRAG